MLKPVNGNLLIEPIKYEAFISSDKNIYEEIGIVIDGGEIDIKKGTKVYFDSWLAGKFPKNEKEYFWLVNWKDIKAIDDGE